MKVLLDENMPPRLRFALTPHDVYTVDHQGWKGLKNGRLLARAEAASFGAFVTVDKNLRYQQNIAASTLGFIVLSSNLWPSIEPSLQRLVEALNTCNAGTIQMIEL